MGKLERIYRRTAAGQRALESQDPELSSGHRQILALLKNEMRWDEMRKVLRRHADLQRLGELEIQGLVAYETAAADADLDFTGSFAFQ
jgi:hypothetical protein